MMKRVVALAVIAGAVVMTFAASAAPNWSGPGTPHGVYAVLPNHGALPQGQHPPATLAQWSGSFTDLTGHSVNYKMVGADPAASNTDTHVTTFVIPVIMTYGASNGNMTFNPKKKFTSGFGQLSVIKALAKSPIFDPGADFVSGSIDCGTSQYVDSWQRCNFWSSVSTNTGYHTILDATKVKSLKPLKITVTPAQGNVINNPFGSGVVGTMSINSFDSALHSYMSAHSSVITADTLPLFISYDIYLTEGGCCIGGYHSASGAQTYSYSTFVDSAGAFSEDVSAISHEVGEWFDDPFTNNHVYCNDNSIMEVGDPLETKANYGTFTVNLHKITWHPQSLVFIPYFGAPTSTSANGWTALHNDLNGGVCPGQ